MNLNRFLIAFLILIVLCGAGTYVLFLNSAPVISALKQTSSSSPEIWPTNLLAGCQFNEKGGECEGTLANLTTLTYRKAINPAIQGGDLVAVEVELLSPSGRVLVFSDATKQILLAETNQTTKGSFLVETAADNPGEFTLFFEPDHTSDNAYIPLAQVHYRITYRMISNLLPDGK